MAPVQDTQSSARRGEILDAATDLFLERGFAGTSMSMVAGASGLTKATLYHHFSSKEALFGACVTHGYARALDTLEAILEDTSLAAPEKMRRGLHAIYDITIGSPVGRMSPLIAEVSRAFPSVARSFHEEYIEPQRMLLSRLLDEGVATGAFTDMDRPLFFHIVFGPIVTLSLSREMFATFPDLDTHFPVGPLREGHIAIAMGLLMRRPEG